MKNNKKLNYVIKSVKAKTEKDILNLYNEADILNEMDHPDIVQFYGAFYKDY